MNTTDMRIPSNRVRDIERYMHAELDALYGAGEVRAFAGMLFEAFLGWDRTHLLLHRDETIDQSDLLRFHWAVEDLRHFRPIQHIVSYIDFCNCRIKVSPDVLIPRPETEEMVQWVCTQLSTLNPQLSILDLCTGSGCIAIALKKAFPNAHVAAVDISPAALALARQNAEENGVGVEFMQADILDSFSIHTPSPLRGTPPGLGGELKMHPCISQMSTPAAYTSPKSGEVSRSDGGVSLIVSNPPYIRESERASMSRNVLDYEPSQALFVPDDDPLRFYRSIGVLATRHLAPQGLLAVEINEFLADETCALFHAQGFNPEVHTDFRAKPRWVSARLVNGR